MNEESLLYEQQSLVFRLRKRAEIRRQIKTRKSVQENKPDRLADLLEEAASYIEGILENKKNVDNIIKEINEERRSV